jgi:DNA polymerase III subunit epsilon
MKTTNTQYGGGRPVKEQHPTWRDSDLVALDLEGSGAQDRDQEAILEIAVVPIIAGTAAVAHAYHTLVNPGRPVPRRPWISPGLTNTVLAHAPPISEVEPHLAQRLNGTIIAGHNIGVDWRLLHRRCPIITPAALLDTMKLSRHLGLTTAHGLGALIDHFGLADTVTTAAVGSQPHRALWDTVAAATLLGTLADHLTPHASLPDLLTIAAVPLGDQHSTATGEPTLFDL